MSKERPSDKDSVTAVVVGATLTVAFTLLLCLAYIGQVAYVTLMVALGLMTIALLASNRLREVDFRNARITLREVEQVRADVYAKAQTLSELAASVATIAEALATDQVPQVQLWGDLQRGMRTEQARGKIRDRVLSILRCGELEDRKAQDIKVHFDTMIGKHLASMLTTAVFKDVQDCLRERAVEADGQRRALIASGVSRDDPKCKALDNQGQASNSYIFDSQRLANFKDLRRAFREGGWPGLELYLREAGVWSAKLDADLNALAKLSAELGVPLAPYMEDATPVRDQGGTTTGAAPSS